MNTTPAMIRSSPDGWAKLPRNNDKITSEDYLEVQFRTHYDPRTGPVLDEVLVRDPKNSKGGVRSFSAEEWKAAEFPIEIKVDKK
jgi:hypothetical protein